MEPKRVDPKAEAALRQLLSLAENRFYNKCWGQAYEPDPKDII